MSYAKNIQSINFDNRTERKGKQNFKSQSSIVLGRPFQTEF